MSYGTGSSGQPNPFILPSQGNGVGVGANPSSAAAAQPPPPAPVPYTTIPIAPATTTGNIAPPPGVAGVARPAVDTLDEPVSATIMRDLKSIGGKLKQVLLPKGDNKNILRDWDLWGPLLLCLALSIRLSVTSEKPEYMFTTIFVIVWCGAGVVTLNSKLLGGKMSFFQSVCVLGYCIFPLVLASFLSLILTWVIVRVPIVGVAFAWAVYASVGFLSDVSLGKRKILATYPMVLFYFIIGWM
ncbi:Yip1 member 6, partial [Rhizophlyctis rosea]